MKTALLASILAIAILPGCNKSDEVAASASGASSPAAPSTMPTPVASTDGVPTNSPNPSAAPSTSEGGVSESDLGVPFYPGSTPAPGSAAHAEGGNHAFTVRRYTGDSPDKVVAFYKDALTKAGFEQVVGGVGDGIGSTSGDKDDGKYTVAVQVAKDPGGTANNLISIAISKP